MDTLYKNYINLSEDELKTSRSINERRFLILAWRSTLFDDELIRSEIKDLIIRSYAVLPVSLKNKYKDYINALIDL